MNDGLMAGPRSRFGPLLLSSLLLAGAVGCGVQAHPTASQGATSGTTGTGGGNIAGTGTGGTTGTTGSGGAFGASGGIGQAGTGGSQATAGTSGTTSSGGATGSGGSTGTGGTGTSGAGVMINGMFVPKEKAITFIHFGHSNMRGMANKPASLMSYFYTPTAGLWSYKGTFTQAKEPTAPEGNFTLAGPGMALLHAAQAASQPGSNAQLISVGYGKGSITTVDYLKSGVYYPVFMNWAKQLKGNVTFAAIVIMLGITDGEHLPSAQVPDFPKRAKQIIDDIRSDLEEPNLPVLFCDYEQGATGQLAPTSAVGIQMIPLIRMLPTVITNLALVPTDGLEMQDDHHFDFQGHKDWTGRVISLMQSKGWWKW